MSDLITSYLGYLRDCARVNSRESDVDMLKRNSSFKVLPLDSSQIRELKSRDGSFLSTDPELLRWRRDARISDESEFMVYLGFPMFVGIVNGNKKISSPLFIAPCELCGEDETQVEVLIDVYSLEVYTPILTELMEISSDADEYSLQNKIETIISGVSKIAPGIPSKVDEIKKVIQLLEQFIPQRKKDRLKGLLEEIREIDLQTINNSRDDEWKIIPSMCLMLTQPLTDFTVAREIDQILKKKDEGGKKATAIELIIKKIGEGSNSNLEAIDTESNVEKSKFLNVVNLSKIQEKAIQYALSHDITVIKGPPGTGKSHTIAALVINLACNSKTVLVTSKTNEAVRVVQKKLIDLGSEYGVAYLGEKKQDRTEFADLIDSIINREHDLKNPKKLQEEGYETENELKKLRIDLIDTEREINRLINIMGEIHISKIKMEELPDLPIPENLLEPEELNKIKKEAESVKKWLSGAKPSFIQRLRSRGVSNKIADKLIGKRNFIPIKSIQTAELTYHSTRILYGQRKIQNAKNMKSLWDRHKKCAEDIIVQSRKVFEAFRRYSLSRFFGDDIDAAAKMRKYIDSLRITGSTAGARRRKRCILDSIQSGFLLKAFPVWACPSAHLTQFLHLEPALFDFVVIDEASLCDPATAIPALYRAKKAVIVGDEKQLKHRDKIADAKLASIAERNNLPPESHIEFGYKKSLYEIAESRAGINQVFMLDEHFRSLPGIIHFSNHKWYRSSLKYMRRSPADDDKKHIEFVHIPGKRNQNDIVDEEIQFSIKTVKEILTQNSIPPSVGVITMTEKQSDHAKACFIASLSYADVEKMKFKVGTPQSFQGDERDYIILCPGFDSDAHPMTLSHALDENRFNVAVTRAKNHMIVISCIPTEDYPGLLREYYEYSLNGSFVDDSSIELCESGLEKQVYNSLRDKQFKIIPQYETCGYRIDFVIIDQYGQYVGVEVDGKQHFDHTGDYVPGDIERELRLRRAGWDIVRVSYLEWENDSGKKSFFDRLSNTLEQRRKLHDSN